MSDGPTVAVSPREREVWSLVAAHLTNQQIADQLCLSVRTVESHVTSLLRKLGAPDRRSLARLAARTHPAGRTSPARRPWPSPTSSFVGRHNDCRELMQTVRQHRMVTVTGPGGVGKTRLAVQVAGLLAAERADGGWFVDLVEVSDPTAVVAAVAAATGVATPWAGPLENALLARLADSDGLLLLDNCEHVLESARACIEQLVHACPSLTVVATSRVRLMAPYEWVHAVSGLPAAELDDDAITLFLERARGGGEPGPLDRALVRDLCASLDGLALAIELAAARVPSMGLDGVGSVLRQDPRRLSGPAADSTAATDRHRSLSATIAWSCALLSPQDRSLMLVISVFASWFDALSASQVAGGDPAAEAADPGVVDGLARLAEAHLLVVAPGAPTRYRQLVTIREYASARLDEQEPDGGSHDRHRDWCRRRLEALAGRPRDRTWCEQLDAVVADARPAAVWAGDHRRTDEAAGLAEQLADQLLLRGRPAEAQAEYELAAALCAVPDRPRLLRLAAGTAATRLVGNDMLRLLQSAADQAATSGQGGSALDLAWMGIFVGYAPGIMAHPPPPEVARAWLATARERDDGRPTTRAALVLAEAFEHPYADQEGADLAAQAARLAQRAGDPVVESVALDRLLSWHLSRHQLADGLTVIDRRERLLARVPLSALTAFQFNDHLLMATEVNLAAGRLEVAAGHADRLAEIDCYRDYPHPALARRMTVDAMAGDLDAAVARGRQFLTAWERAGRPVAGTLNVSAYALAMVHGLLDDDDGRRRWIEVAGLLTTTPVRLAGATTGWAPTFDSLLWLDRGESGRALARMGLELDDEIWGAGVNSSWRPWYAALWAEAAVTAGHPDAGRRLDLAREAVRENPVAATMVERATDIARGDLTRLPHHALTFERLGCHYQRRRTELLGRRLAPGRRR